MMVDIEKEERINRTAWTVDPHNPPKHLVRELEQYNMTPGTPEAVLWVEQWRYWMTEKKARQGNEEARQMLESGAVEVSRPRGDGVMRAVTSIRQMVKSLHPGWKNHGRVVGFRDGGVWLGSSRP